MSKGDTNAADGWEWFDGGTDPSSPEQAAAEHALALAAARCFRGSDGEKVLGYLRAMTLERGLGPAASDAQLRHLEGQRQLVVHIGALVERGRQGA